MSDPQAAASAIKARLRGRTGRAPAGPPAAPGSRTAVPYVQEAPQLGSGPRDPFSVDGTLIEAWASMKSFRPTDGSDEPPPPGGGRNREADFHGQKRSNETHASTTDPEARLYRKGPGKEAKLCFMGHALIENRNGLVVDDCLTEANGHAERIAALHMIEPARRPADARHARRRQSLRRRGLRQ